MVVECQIQTLQIMQELYIKIHLVRRLFFPSQWNATYACNSLNNNWLVSFLSIQRGSVWTEVSTLNASFNFNEVLI